MPEKIERELKKTARKKGLKGESFNAYVWGTIQSIKKSKEHKNNSK